MLNKPCEPEIDVFVPIATSIINSDWHLQINLLLLKIKQIKQYKNVTEEEHSPLEIFLNINKIINLIWVPWPSFWSIDFNYKWTLQNESKR